MARAYRAAGFPVVVRQPKSQSPYDVLAVKLIDPTADPLRGRYSPARKDVHLVQCKMGGYMRPSEREELKALAAEVGAVPVLASGGRQFTRDGVKYFTPITRVDIRNGRDLGDLDVCTDDGPTAHGAEVGER